MPPPTTADPPAPAASTKSQDTGENRDQRIARAAYLLAERDGFPADRDLEYWLKAESEVDQASATLKR
jgi:hypothetical protein